MRTLRWPAIWVGALGLELLAGGLLVWLAGRHGPALLAVLVNLAVCIRFALTLRPGSVPLITFYARFDERGLPPECEAYTRALTALWVAVLAAFALAHAGALMELWTTRTMAMVQSVVLVALFLGEHPVRGRLFPQLGRVTPMRTLRAMRLSFGAPHAG